MYKEKFKEYLKILVTSVLYLEKKQVIIVYGATFLIISLFFFNLKVFPSIMKVNESKKIIKDLERSIEIANKRVEGFKIYKKKLKDMDEVFHSLRGRFIKKGEVQSLVSMVAKYGDEAGVDFIEFNPLPSGKNRYLLEIPLSLSIKGDFTEIYEFIGKLSEGLCLITVDRIKISSDSNSKNLSVQCIIKGYGTDEL